MFVNHLVDFSHDADGFIESHYDALVVGDVVRREGAAFSVFEPLFADLIAADVEIPDIFRHSFKTLSRIDPDGVVLPRRFLGNGVITLAGEGSDEVIDRGGFQQVQGNQLAAEFGK